MRALLPWLNALSQYHMKLNSTETSPGRCLHYCLCSTMEANKSILCFYLSALVPVLTNHFIKILSRQYAEQPVTAAHITMSNFKTKPPVSVGMCRCQLPAKKNHLKMKDYISTKKGATSKPYNDKSYWRSLSHLIPKATIVP